MSNVRNQPQRAATLRRTYEDDGYPFESQSEPSEAEFNQKRKRPPKKKSRYTAVRTLRGSDSGRRRNNLSKFLDLPLDVLYEIFGALHPKDILSLSRANQAFRETLRAPSARCVWRAAMDRDDAPPCPSDWTGPRWAALLYDRSCQNYEAKNIQRVDFYIRRRLCAFCKKVLLVSKDGIIQETWEFCDIQKIMDLTPSTPEPPSGERGTVQYWHYGDLDDTDDTLVVLGDYNEILTAWTAKRLNLLEEIEELAEWCDVWKRHKDELHRENEEIIAQQRLQGIRNRLQALGYSIDDIVTIDLGREARRSSPLNERYWRKIKGDLVSKVEAARDARLRNEIAANWTPIMTLPLLAFCLLVDHFSSR